MLPLESSSYYATKVETDLKLFFSYIFLFCIKNKNENKNC